MLLINVGNLCFEDDFVTNLTESGCLERECESVVREAKHLTRQDHIEDKMDLFVIKIIAKLL